jgi:hypothetical protein
MTSPQTTTNEVEQAQSLMGARVAAVFGHDDSYVPQGSHERSISVKSETAVPQSTIILFWVDEVPSEDNNLRRNSQSLLNDAHLHSMSFDKLRMISEVTDLIREGHFKYSFYGEECEWTKDSQIEARRVHSAHGYFWRMFVPRNSDLRPSLDSELDDNGSAWHNEVASSPNHSGDKCKNEFVKMLKIYASAASCVGERRYGRRRWLLLSTHSIIYSYYGT